MRGVSDVYHAAAHISFDPRDSDLLWEVNVTGTANMVNASLNAGIDRFCHVSSIAALGPQHGETPVNEDSPWENDADLSDYARSKYEAELEVYRGSAEGLRTVIVCPSVIIGPCRQGRSTRTLLDRVIGGTLFHPPGSTHVVDVRDVAELSVRLMSEGLPGERYVLAGPQVDYKNLFHQIARAAGGSHSRFTLQRWMLELAWRADRIRGLLTGSRSLITRHTARTAMRDRRFDDRTVREQLGASMRSVDDMFSNAVSFC